MKSLVLNALNTAHSRRALLVFHAAAFLPSTDLYRHSGLLLTRTIAEALDEAGYVVDVADWNEATGEKYDLVVDAKCNIHQGVKRDCPLIFLAVHRADENERLLARYDALNKRGRALKPDRTRLLPPLCSLEQVTQIVCVGNNYTADSWRAVYPGPIACINNVAYPDIEYVGEKDWESARRNFLFFAGRGAVHKGLDLLLEVFAPHRELELWIAQVRDVAFYQTYWREFEAPNIHLVGWTGINSPQWEMLTRECAYTIHPSCSEGQAGAVVQGMAAGLVPLVTRESGLDDVPWVFTEDTIYSINQLIVEAARHRPEWLAEDSQRIRSTAMQGHSVAAVKAQFRRALDTLCK